MFAIGYSVNSGGDPDGMMVFLAIGTFIAFCQDIRDLLTTPKEKK